MNDEHGHFFEGVVITALLAGATLGISTFLVARWLIHLIAQAL